MPYENWRAVLIDTWNLKLKGGIAGPYLGTSAKSEKLWSPLRQHMSPQVKSCMCQSRWKVTLEGRLHGEWGRFSEGEYILRASRHVVCRSNWLEKAENKAGSLCPRLYVSLNASLFLFPKFTSVIFHIHSNHCHMLINYSSWFQTYHLALFSWHMLIL